MGDPWAAEAGPLDIPDDLREWIKPELAPGERLIWASRADRVGRRDRRGNMVAWSWSAGLLVVAVLMIGASTAGWARPAESALMTFGIVIGLVGGLIGVLSLASLINAARDRRALGRRAYALTDRRAILWTPVPGSEAVTVHVYPRGSIAPGQIERTQYPDGSGTLALQGGYSAHGNFEGIADVRRVEDLVRRYLVASGADPTP